MMKKNINWNQEKLGKWEQMNAIGRSKFLLLYGVAGCGLAIGLNYASTLCASGFISGSAMLITAAIASAFGIIISNAVWTRMNSSYEKHLMAEKMWNIYENTYLNVEVL